MMSQPKRTITAWKMPTVRLMKPRNLSALQSREQRISLSSHAYSHEATENGSDTQIPLVMMAVYHPPPSCVPPPVPDRMLLNRNRGRIGVPLWPEKSSPSGQVVFVEISVKSREIRLLEAIQQCCVRVEKPPFCIHLGAKMGDIPSINSDVRKRPWQSIRLRLSLVISFLESGFVDCHSRPRRFNVNLSWRQGVLPISWYGIVLNSLICFLFF